MTGRNTETRTEGIATRADRPLPAKGQADRVTKHRDPNRGDCDPAVLRLYPPLFHKTKHRDPNRGDCDEIPYKRYVGAKIEI